MARLVAIHDDADMLTVTLGPSAMTEGLNYYLGFTVLTLYNVRWYEITYVRSQFERMRILTKNR